MPKAFHILLLSLSIFCTACFEIVEEVDLNDDGSGSFKITLNMSRSKKEIDAARLLDSMGTIAIPSQDYLETQIVRGKHILNTSKGISGVKVFKDYDNYIFELSFDFDRLSSLNTAVGQLYAELSSLAYPFHTIFSFGSRQFSRKMDRQSREIFTTLQKKNARMTEEATYTAIYRFASAVNNTSNPDAKISNSGKAVMLHYKVQDLANGRKSLQNDINFK